VDACVDEPHVVGAFADLYVAEVARSIAFYRSLLGLEVIVDHEWYAELGAGGRTLLALVQRGHPTVPPAAGSSPSGLDPAGEVVEHYLEISEPATTCVAILLRPPAPRQAPTQR